MKGFKLFALIFLVLSLSISSSLLVLAVDSDDESDSDQAVVVTISKAPTPTERKNEILRNYQSDLSNLQEIGFGVKIKASDEKEVEQRVHPDVHFRSPDGKEYLVFYNTGIPELREAVFQRLQQNVSEHPHILSYDRSALLEKAQKSKSKADMRLPIQVLRLILGICPYKYRKENSIFNR